MSIFENQDILGNQDPPTLTRLIFIAKSPTSIRTSEHYSRVRVFIVMA